VSDEETSGIDYYDVKGFTWFNGEKALSEAFKDLSTERLLLDGLRWLGIEEKYFIAVMLSKDSLVSGAALRGEQLYSARLSGSEKEASFSVYVGPKSYEILKDAGYELQRNIKFGWTGFIAAPLLLLLHWFYALFGNYGVAIVALTILVRTLLYPLNAASFKSMKAMQDLKPEIDRIREQVTDKQQQQLELMGMYKKHGVNPLGGCLPILLQMPIFIGLYSALMLAIELRHAPFALWVLDLSAPEKCMIAGFGVPVMVILFVLSMMVQQWTTPSQMDPVQKRVMMVMPIVFGFLFMNMPAGLTLYWLTNNIISIGQQKAMYKFGPTQAKKALGVTLAVAAVTFVLALLLSLTAGS
jgi:YidC/Oxa1 family membrane protein insertase